MTVKWVIENVSITFWVATKRLMVGTKIRSQHLLRSILIFRQPTIVQKRV